MIRSNVSLVALLATLLAPAPAGACPACYLQGSLAPAVKAARTIYVGDAVRSIGPARVELKVSRVLRGSLKIGQRVQVRAMLVDGQLGKPVLVIEPAEWPSGAPAIGGELEDEVRFLMQRRPRIASADEAVRRAAGVSVEARAAGRRYLRSHRQGASALLIREIERLKPLVLASKQGFFDEHRLEHLVGELLAEVDAPARAWALGEVDGFLRRPWRALRKNGVLDDPGSRGLLLEWLLSSVSRKHVLRGELRRRLESGLGRLAGEGIALAVYALAGSGTTRPSDHGPLAKDEQTHAVAMGLFLAGLRAAREGESAKARALLGRARTLARSAALRTAVDEHQSTD